MSETNFDTARHAANMVCAGWGITDPIILDDLAHAFLALDAENAALRALLKRAALYVEGKHGNLEDEIREALENKHAT